MYLGEKTFSMDCPIKFASSGIYEVHIILLIKRLIWWHISDITCQIIMSTCQIFMLTFQLFMSTCQIIMSACQKNIITTNSLISCFLA